MSAGLTLVRDGREEDLAEVVRLERGLGTAPHWAEAEYRAMLQTGASEGVRRSLLVATRAGRVVGFVVVRLGGERADVEAEVESIAVAAEEQRSGVGSLLLASALEVIRGAGATAVRLEVRASGVAAQALYGRFGFVVEGRRPGYYVEPVEDALLMRRGGCDGS